jgi:hypothetical protein
VSEKRPALIVILTFGLLGGGAAVGFALGRFIGDGSLHDWVLSFAGATELFGVLLVAAPEIAPILARAWRALQRVAASVKTMALTIPHALRRLTGRPAPTKPVELNLSDASGVSEALSLRLSTDPKGTTDEKISYLLRRDQATQQQLQAMAAQIGTLPDSWRREIDHATTRTQKDITERLHKLRDQHLRARLLGLALLVLGIALNTWGNLI